MNYKHKILWISRFAPVSKADSAGSRTLYYYFSKFRENPEFDIKLIASGFYKDFDIIERENASIEHAIIYWNNPTQSIVSKLINVESKFNPFNKFAGLISNTDVNAIIRSLQTFKFNGYMPDIVILEWTNMVVLANEIKKIFPTCKIVASEHDVTFVGYRRKADYYSGLKGKAWELKYRKERSIELSALKKCDLILVQNWDNRNLLMKEGLREENIQWLVPFFNDMRDCSRKPNGKDILFFGAMARPENYLSAIWFIEKVMPLIKDMDVRFVVLGSNPPEELKKFESSRIHITGFVDSIVPFFENAVCLVAPLVLGAGIKVKIIEALSSGVPVLTNDIGIEGISAKDGREYIHCVEPSDFARAIRKIFANPSAGAEMAINAKSYIEKNYLLEKSFDDYKYKLLELGERK